MDVSSVRMPLVLLLAIWCLWQCRLPASFVGNVQQLGSHSSPLSSGKSNIFRNAVAVDLQEEAEEDAFAEGDQVVLTAPPALAGSKGTIVHRVDDDAFAVQLESGSVFHIPTEKLEAALTILPIPMKAAGNNAFAQLKKRFGKVFKKPDMGAAKNHMTAGLQAASSAWKNKGAAAPKGEATPASVQEESLEEDEDIFAAGEEVILTAPPAMAGKKGTIVKRVEGDDAFTVRLASGSEFNIQTGNIKSREAKGENFFSRLSSNVEKVKTHVAANAKATLPAKKANAFRTGQHVILTAPPQMAGTHGMVVQREGDGYSVQLEGGDVLKFDAGDIKDAGIKGFFSKLSKSIPVVKTTKTDPEEEENVFTEGQKVVLTAPPQMAGEGGTIIERVDGNSFAVQLRSGSILNLPAENIKEATAENAINVAGKGLLSRAKAAWAQAVQQVKSALGRSPVASSMAAVGSGTSQPASIVSQADEEQLDDADFLEEGQEVVLSAPPAMAGKRGTITGPVEGVQGDVYAVRLSSGSVFNIPRENIQEASSAGGSSGGGRGIGGFGTGGGGAGKPPSSSNSAAGDLPRKPGQFGWIASLLVGALIVSWVSLLFKNGQLRLPRLRVRNVKLPRWRIDRKPISLSSGSSPLGALVILAAVGLAMAVQKYLPAVIDWLQEHLKSQKLTLTRERISFRANLEPQPSEDDGFTMLDAFLLAAAAVLAISWWLAARSKHRNAASPPRAAMMKNLVGSDKQVSFAAALAMSEKSHGLPQGSRGRGNPNEGSAASSRSVSPFARERPPMLSGNSYSVLPMVGASEGLSPKEGCQPRANSDTNLLDGLWPMAATTDPDATVVNFLVEMKSKTGDRLLVVGSDESLGDWVPERSLVELHTDEDSYPMWSGRWQPYVQPAEHNFKLVIVNEKGQYFWEDVINRTMFVPAGGDDRTVEMKFNRASFTHVNTETLSAGSSLVGS